MTLAEMDNTPLDVVDAANRALDAWQHAGRVAHDKATRKGAR